MAEERITSSTGGQKGQKLARFGLIDSRFLQELAIVCGKGAKKYSDDNWRKGYNWELSYSALQRHLHLFLQGENLDEESKLSHLAHAAWHCMVLYVFSGDSRYADFDTRALPPGYADDAVDMFADAVADPEEWVGGVPAANPYPREDTEEDDDDEADDDYDSWTLDDDDDDNDDDPDDSGDATDPTEVFEVAKHFIEGAAGEIMIPQLASCCESVDPGLAHAVHQAGQRAKERAGEVIRTEVILGKTVDFLAESEGYIDGQHLLGTAFTSTVARLRRGFANIDDELTSIYRNQRS